MVSKDYSVSNIALNNRAKAGLKFLAVFALVFAVFMTYSVLASHIVLIGPNHPNPDNSTIYSNRTTSLIYNITVNNTDFTVANSINITNVTIVLPLGINFSTSLSNETSPAATNVFTNVTVAGVTNLTWTNITNVLQNSSLGNNTRAAFNFNATAGLQGVYNITVFTVTTNGSRSATNITVIVDDVIPNATYASPTIATGLYANTLVVNVSAQDSVGIGGFEIRLYGRNNLTLLNTSISAGVASTSASYTINFSTISNLADGVYFYNATVNDTSPAHNNITVTRNITLDTVQPNITLNTGSLADGLNKTGSSVSVNVTVANTVIINGSTTFTAPDTVNVTISIFNSTFGLINATSFTSAGINSSGGYVTASYVNVTGLSEGVYYYNATAIDSANNKNSSATRKVTIDNTGPTVNFVATSTATNALTIGIVPVDTVSGVSNTTCVQTAGLGLQSGMEISSTGLNCGTSYSFSATCIDYTGNSNSGSASFTTSACSGAGGGSSGGGSGSGGTAGGYTWTNTFTVDNTAFMAGDAYRKTLAPKGRARFYLGTNEHSVGILEVTATSAKIVVQSTPQEATLMVGESKKFDVDGDGFYDTKVTLNAIVSGSADVSVQYIHEAVSAAATPAETTGTTTESTPATTTEGTTASSSYSSTTKIILAIVVILIVAGVIIYNTKKRR